MKFPVPYWQSTRNLFPLIMVCLCGLTFATPLPIVEFKFDAGSGTSLTNTGTAGGSATRTTIPAWSTNIWINGGSNSLDFGVNSSTSNYVDFANTTGLKNLKSFTITGWLNAKSAATIGGGNRILNFNGYGTYDNHGVDLAMHQDGSIGLGINDWNHIGNGVSSTSGKITVDPNSSFNNWVFFAVTYSMTSSSGQVKFYFGTNSSNATLDAVYTLTGAQAVGANVSPTLTIGQLAPAVRAAGGNATSQMFRGLIDNIAIYGSTVDGSGALSQSEIVLIQDAAPITGVAGLLYQQWDNITGTAVSALESNANYPNSPSATMVRPNFDAFQNRADNFGAKLSGWIKPPLTGQYTFWIACNNNGLLRLSTSSDPKDTVQIAKVTDYTDYQQWDKVGQETQKSALINLEAGKFYYIEALVKEATNSDHLSVGWQLPNATMERPIQTGSLFLTPANAEEFFPSAIHLYQSGTPIQKATVGWNGIAGNEYLYVEADKSKVKITGSTISIPQKLEFGGDALSPNTKISLKWINGDAQSTGKLAVQDKDGVSAMTINGPSANTNNKPMVDFNDQIFISGQVNNTTTTSEFGGATLNGSTGLGFIRTTIDTSLGSNLSQDALFNGSGLTLSSVLTMPTVSTETRSIQLNPKELRISKSYGSLNEYTSLTENKIFTHSLSVTDIDAETITANTMITTPKWKVIPDFVFQKDYKLTSLAETESFVQKHKHLPNVPSAEEMSTQGMDITAMNLNLLKTMEEMTLHLIAMDKKLTQQEKQISIQKQKNASLEKKLQAIKMEGK